MTFQEECAVLIEPVEYPPTTEPFTPLNAWAHRGLWGCAAVVLGGLLLSLYYQPVGWAPIAVAASLAVLAASRPFDALLVLAALGPLATVLFVLTRVGSIGLHFEQAMTLACLAGGSARRALEPRRLAVSPWLQWSAALLITSAVTSAVVGGARIAAEQPGVSLPELLHSLLVRDFLISSNDLTAAMLFVKGLLLVLIVADLCAAAPEKRARALVMMVLGAAAAALLNVLRIVTFAVSREEPWTALLANMLALRVNIHHGDLNAAGSYFSMMIFLAAGLAVRSPLVGVPSALLLVAGLWVSGSRTALAATLGTAALAALLGLRVARRRLATAIVLALLALGAFAVWKWYPEGRNAASGIALKYRIEGAETGVKLLREQPMFGVGIGRFYSQSARYWSVPENAHNNFIQILAESGVTGLLLFLAVIVFAVRKSWRDHDPLLRGLLVGIGAFLITCLAGHPMLTAPAAYPFWMALGLASVSSGPPGTLPRGIRMLAVGLLIVFTATLPFRMAAAGRNADVEHASSGFSKWQRAPDGSRYRWAGGHAIFFIPSSARAVRIPLRRGPDAPPSIEVRVFLDGREADRALLHEGEDSRIVRLVLARKAEARFARIDLEAVLPRTLSRLQKPATETSGVLMVGRPVIEQ